MKIQKNVLLIPTTDNIITNWSNVYKYFVEKGHKVYIITDNKYITKSIPNEFIQLELYVMKLFQSDKLSLLKKIIVILYLNIFVRHILNKYLIDTVIVSNDNPIIQNIFTNISNSMGIKTILHQASGIFEKPKKIHLIKKIQYTIYKKIFNFYPSGNIGANVQQCLLQGRMWSDYVNNQNIDIVGNQFFYDFKDFILKYNMERVKELKNRLNSNNKTVITFFSQPFDVLNITNDANMKKLYEDFLNISKEISKNDKFVFIFKTHPQENYYKKFDIKGIISDIDVTDLLLVSDITISVYSTMSIQSKIASKITLGYLPKYLPSTQKNQMKDVFDIYYDDFSKLVNDLLKNEFKIKKNSINDVMNLELNTKELIYKELI